MIIMVCFKTRHTSFLSLFSLCPPTQLILPGGDPPTLTSASAVQVQHVLLLFPLHRRPLAHLLLCLPLPLNFHHRLRLRPPHQALLNLSGAPRPRVLHIPRGGDSSPLLCLFPDLTHRLQPHKHVSLKDPR